MVKRIRKYFTKPFCMAMCLSIVFAAIYFFWVPQYNAVYESGIQNLRKTYYHDLDEDSISEKIEYFGYELSVDYTRATLITKNCDNAILGIWNHTGRFIKKSNPFFCDYNNDGTTEIFTYHRRKDSIFINGINPGQGDFFFLKDRFIDLTRKVNGTVHLNIHNIQSTDYNKDGYQDILFMLNAGFSVQPRNFYMFDIKNDTLFKSPESFARFTYPCAIPYNIDEDSANEYILSTHAASNLKDLSVPFHDHACYLMVLDDDLSLKFNPRKFHSSLSTISTYPVEIGAQKFLLSFFNSNTKKHSDSLLLHTMKGRRLRAIKLKSYLTDSHRCYFKGDYTNYKTSFPFRQIAFISNKGTMFEFDTTLKLLHKKKLPFEDVRRIIPVKDLNNDAENDIIILTNDNIVFTDLNYNLYAKAKIPEYTAFSRFNIVWQGADKNPLYFFQGHNSAVSINFKTNLWYQYGWLVVLIFFLLTWFVFYLLWLIRRLSSEYRMSKILQEREEHKALLSRDLHDELGSRITALKIKINQLQVKNNTAELRALSSELQKTHEELRNIIYNLSPPRLNGQSFYQSIQQLGKNFKELGGFEVSVEFIPDTTIVDFVDIYIQKALYRIVQEGMNNILKHSEAKQVVVQFIRQKDCIELFIDDDGKGFLYEPATVTDGQGLKSMETRVKILHGVFKIYTKPHKGTSLVISVPAKKSRNVKSRIFNFINR